MNITTLQLTFSADSGTLNNRDKVRTCLDEIVKDASLTKLEEVGHAFQPQGQSIVYVLSESHIAIHTWPENNFAYITLSSCKANDIDEASILAVVKDKLNASNITIEQIKA